MTPAHVVRAALLPAALTIGLAACGGGSSHIVPPPVNANQSTATTTRGSATFRITIPATAPASLQRRAQYVSSATASVLINVTQNGAELAGFPLTIPVTAGSANCTTGAAGTTCTLSVNVLPGTYSASITTLDTNGNALSAAVAVPLTITPGTVTSIPLTLDGVIATLAIAPTPSNAASFVSGSAAAGYALIGQGPRSFTISALDAAGNTIVGAGAPSFSVTMSGAAAFTLTPPASASANTFTLAAPSSWTSGANKITVTAAYADGTSCTAAGSTCSASFNVSMRELLFYYNSTQGELYASGDTTPLVRITQGINNPSPVSWSPDGDIQVSSDGAGPNYVNLFAFPYQSAPYATITSALGNAGIVWTTGSDPSNDLIVSDFFNNTIRVFAPPFVTPATPPNTASITITNGLAEPGGFSVDHQGNLWVGNSNYGAGDDITEYAAKTFNLLATVRPPFTVPNGFCCTENTVAPDGTMVAWSGPNPNFYVYAPPYTGPPVTVAAPAGSNAGIDAADDLFLEEPGAGSFITSPPYTTTTPLAPGIYNCSIDDAGTLFCINNSQVSIYPKPWSGTPSVTYTTTLAITRTPMVIP